MPPVHATEAIAWGLSGAIAARCLGMAQLINEQAWSERSKRKSERRSKWRILIAFLRGPYLWITNALHLAAAGFVVALFIRDGIAMTARLAVFIGAAAPARLNDVVGSLSPPGGPSRGGP